jgi:hypothetical protein
MDCPKLIPLSLDNCPTYHLLHNGQALGNIPLHEGKYDIKCGVHLRGKSYRVLIWAMWHEYRPPMEKAMPSHKDISNDQEFARWMATKALGHSINNFTQLANACICIIEENNYDI